VTQKAGIHFQHANGSFGKKLLPETLGPGVAFIDYDNDGWQDLLFVNSCPWPGHEDYGKPTLALYRNRGDGTFEDVTARAGLDATMYGLGVTVGDYDNDGWPDVFITGVGGNRLFHNEHGHFVDVTRRAGVGGPAGWPAAGTEDFLSRKDPMNLSTSATFLDFDRDGLLDLFVCNYVTWSPYEDMVLGFQLTGIGRAFGPPRSFPGSQCFLYRNLGGGRFEDVSAKAGVQVAERGQPIAKALGVIACDVDDDGWPDILVANDTVRNFFFHNKGDGTFEEIGIESGLAYAEGQARGAMGIDVGQYRPARREGLAGDNAAADPYLREGQTAVLIGNFANEPDTFLRLDSPHGLLFSDTALAEGIAGPSRLLLKFGVFFFDYDLDGRLDVLTCNGHLEPEIGQVQSGQTYRQPVQLFWNCGGKCSFVPVTAEGAGPDLFQPMVGRGCAFGDIDNNGTLDVVLTQNGGPARLLRNEGGSGNHWVRLVLEGDGQRANRSAIGARVELTAGDIVQHCEVRAGRGYLSQSELPLTFGLGKTAKIDQVTIRWPCRDGQVQVLRDLAVDHVHHIRQPAKASTQR
jgi:hypothetical protein